jgi:predicted HicB family RNase H-like nuclease
MEIKSIQEEIDTMATITQVSARVDTDFRDKLKLVALKRKITLNDLVIEYLTDGLNKDKDKLE